MKEFFKGFAASAAQVGAACVVKWAIVGAVTFACPPAGAAVSSAMTAYSVGMTAYSVGKCAYDNYDTLQEIGDAALAGDLGQIAAWGIDAVCSMSYEQLGSLAFDAVSIAAPVARAKGAKAVADAKAASVAASAEKVAKVAPVVGSTKNSLPTKLDLDALSKAGQEWDRGGLTRAGRALDKHGNRSGSVFPRAFGNPEFKNVQGQFHLDDILTHPESKFINCGLKGFEIYSPDGRGAYFYKDGTFRGFLKYRELGD
ncbi:hypothetical protein [Waddlia chondrophila]|uniref:Uncharacterized protein n=1 Tax=Waddlia chondrophila (strain ATCC VR-1470 / WSU 86-1044) TaxID=716544 RepID=D6YUF2_WADCW|nr:hypothetical protein [Waddlia chondrophila]ADI37763.1 hypothetical protein wcw_0391 [Waddlia chondrophila WSU 86-1044]